MYQVGAVGEQQISKGALEDEDDSNKLYIRF